MNKYEARYHQNRSIFGNKSAPSLTLLGNNKSHKELVAEITKDPDSQVNGVLTQNKLSKNFAVQEMMRNRRARIEKFTMRDEKTYFTGGERKDYHTKIRGESKSAKQK